LSTTWARNHEAGFHRTVDLAKSAAWWRAGQATPLASAAADYLPGDIVARDLGRGALHIGRDRPEEGRGAPLAVHNIGGGAREEDILFRFSVIGHYRLPAAATSSPVVSH